MGHPGEQPLTSGLDYIEDNMNTPQQTLFLVILAIGLSMVSPGSAGEIAQKTNTSGPRPSGPAPSQRVLQKQALKAGAVAPDFISQDLEGNTVRLSDFKGKVLVLDFWATWCGPCLQSLPHTQEVAKRYRDQEVVVLAVCTADTRTGFEKWMKANPNKYPDIHFSRDPHERGSEAYEEQAAKKLYGIHSIPAQFVIGQDGKIRAVVSGYKSGDLGLEAALNRAGIRVEDTLLKKAEEQTRQRETEDATRSR